MNPTSIVSKVSRRRTNSRTFALALVALCIWSCTPSEPVYDIVFTGATLFDGTGAPGVTADLAVNGDRIAAILPHIEPSQGRRVIEVDGLFLAPGFIDSHAHSSNLAEFPDAENFLRQGITTTMATLHSQDPPWPLESTTTLRSALNLGIFAGHTWARRTVMGTDNREATPEELEEMKELVEVFMKGGALGLSTGLEYIPAVYATTEEVVALARVAAQHDGVYTTHMRDEGPGLLDSIDETIRVAEEAGLPALINHHKVIGVENSGRSRDSLERIDAARRRGVDITHDLYPYTAYSTYSSIVFPPWSLAGGAEELKRRLADPQTRRRIAEGIETFLRQQAGGTLDTIQFRTFEGHDEWEGRTVQEFVAATQAERGRDDVSLTAGIEVLMELEPEGGFTGIFHAINEDDLIRILEHPLSMIESDGDLLTLGEGHPHPRSLGSFPRVLARYVRELGVLSWEQAIHKMTGLPAAFFNRPERGSLEPGKVADLVVFDPQRIRDVATYEDPHHQSEGVVHLVISGTFVIEDERLTGARPGKVLYRSSQDSSP